MNRRTLFFFAFCFLLFAFGLSAQNTWVHTYAPFGSGDDENYTVRNIVICQDGGYSVNGTYIYDDSPYVIFEFGFLMKTDSDGNFQWAKKDTVSFIERTESYAFVETDDGGFISAVTNSTIGGGNALIKRDSEGNREWVVDNGEFQVWSMAKTSDGNIVLSGILSLGLPAIRKMTQNGVELWTQTYNPSNNRETGRLFSIIETSDGGLAATGYIQGNGLDIFILKTDAVGDTMWTKTYDGCGYADFGYSIIESDGNFIICGSYDDFVSPQNIFLKYSTEGNLILEHHFNEFMIVFSVIETQDQNFVSADQQYLFKFDSSFNIIWIGESNSGSSGGDRTIQQLNNLGFVTCHPYLWSSHFWIKKTNEIGYLPVSENVIKSNDEITFSCFPNPFNPLTTIKFSISNSTKVLLQIFNVKGQLVKTLLNDEIQSGEHSIIWDADNQASGVYFYKFDVNGKTKGLKKMLLLK